MPAGDRKRPDQIQTPKIPLILSLVNMEVIPRRETPWNRNFHPKFQSHQFLEKYLHNGVVGEITIVTWEYTEFFSILLDTPATVEAIGVNLLNHYQSFDFIAIYIPKADCETEEIEFLLNRKT